LIGAALCVLLVVCLTPDAQAAGVRRVPKAFDLSATKGAPVPDKPDAAPGEMLVKFKPGRARAAMDNIRATRNIRVTASSRFRRMDWHVVKVRSDRSLKDVIIAYRESPDVLYAEPNYRVRALEDQHIPDDPRFDDLWGMHNTGQTGGTPDADIDAPEAWYYEILPAPGQEIIVAVVDTGVDYNHPDLAPVMWTNAGEIPDNGVDDDGNGFIDDVKGWDFYNNDNDPMDDESHGTHVAGIVAAVPDNGIGVAGVAGRAGTVRIMAVKFLDENGDGYLSDAIYAITYAMDNGATVLNNSWGGGGYVLAMRDLIADVDVAGGLFVAAAGNKGNNTDISAHYPSGYDNPNILSVASTTRTDGRSSFSNYGLVTVDLGAPGSSILSTTPENDYRWKSGTSMATPHVAGACAFVWAAAGTGTSHMEIKGAIMGGVDQIPALLGICVTGGRLNLKNSIDALPGRLSRIISPNGGESFEAGATAQIEWSAFGADWLPADEVRLDCSANDGVDWNPIPGAENLPYDLRTFDWDTTGYAPGSQYIVKVTSLADPSAVDAGDQPFAITGPLDHFDFVVDSPQMNEEPVEGTCLLTAKDAAGVTVGTVGSFNTAGRFPVTVDGTGVAVTGLSGGGDALDPEDFIDGVADLAALGMILTVAAPPQNVYLAASSVDAKTGDSNTFDVVPPHLLTVQSSPFDNAVITGDKPGTTPYAVRCNDGETVSLTAPWEHQGRYFTRWKNTQGMTLTLQGALTLVLTDAITVIAEYGDVVSFYVNDATPENGIAAGDDANPGTSPDAPMASIQSLLDRYTNLGAGRTLNVSDGTYTENVSLGASHSGLTFEGAGAVVTTIDGNFNGPCLVMSGFATGTISGFTFTNGDGLLAGGIECESSSPTISNSRITNNTGLGVGGIDVWGGSPIITNNVFAGNSSPTAGGAIACDLGSSPTIINNVIADNSGFIGGGVLCFSNSSAMLVNNTIADNNAADEGGAIMCYLGTADIKNSILWGNTAPLGHEISLEANSAITIGYSNLDGGGAEVEVESGSVFIWDPGNIDDPPLFADPAGGDYHLKSVYGRWEPTGGGGEGAWAIDNELSPSIDAGDPTSDSSNEPQANGGAINMGAYGNTTEASKSAFLLDVESTPIIGMNITGDKPGTTNYTVPCDDQEAVCLAAPGTVILGGLQYNFVRWVMGGTDQPLAQTDVAITMDADITAEAEYDLFGDVTGDCEVDILDLIAVRNHMYEEAGTDDNWQYDLTGDGLINVLDLIAVRNHLYTVCGQ